MNRVDVLKTLNDVAYSQWGMVTTAQASALRITRLQMARLAEDELYERVAHGVYKSTSVPADQFQDLKAAWLSTEPKRLAEERLKDLTEGIIVSSTSAAELHGIGDIWATRHEFISKTRHQTQKENIRYRQRQIAKEDIALVEGLPTLTLERTIVDLLEEVGELSLVADALRDASLKRPLDFERMAILISPLATRNGFKHGDGNSLLEKLKKLAGINLEMKNN